LSNESGGTVTTSRQSVSRRAFLTAVPAAGVGLAASAAEEEAGARKALRIGCLNVGDYSHLSGLWGPLINPRGPDDITFTTMRITHCWDIDESRSKGFAETFGCEPVNNYDDMVGKVDGIISGGFYNHPWDHIIHRPYLEAGLPNLINRPFSNCLQKAREMVDVARKHGATIMTPSAMEHNDTIARAKEWATGKEIRCYTVTNSHNDYATHGIHGVYLMNKAIVEAGNPVVSVAYQANSWYRPPGVLTYEHVDKDGRQFFGTLHEVSGSWGTVSIHTPEAYGGKTFDIHTGTGFPYDKTEIWAPTVWAFERMARQGVMPQTFEQLLHRNNTYLAGFRSIVENDGKPVRLEEVPADWRAPVLPPDTQAATVDLLRKKFGEA
jgi:predicted dehydrogenase